jgi:hypothetical protein
MAAVMASRRAQMPGAPGSASELTVIVAACEPLAKRPGIRLVNRPPALPGIAQTGPAAWTCRSREEHGNQSDGSGGNCNTVARLDRRR